MENSELIENYFTSSPDSDQVRVFEKKIESDPAFAKEVAFYLSVHTMARDLSQSERKLQFRELYQKGQAAETSSGQFSTPITYIKSHTTPVRKLIYYIAAAAVVAGISFGIYTYIQPASTQQLAVKYEQEHLTTLGVTMGHTDSLQRAINQFNEGKFEQALIQFEQMNPKNNADSKVAQYAGLSALHLNDYDKALTYFKQLESFTLYSNPAVFYQAVTLMKRNQSGDADAAKLLLQQVVQKDLEGKEKAQEWLHDWKN